MTELHAFSKRNQLTHYRVKTTTAKSLARASLSFRNAVEESASLEPAALANPRPEATRQASGNNSQSRGVYRVDMPLYFGSRTHQWLGAAVIALLAFHSRAQKAGHPVLVSHDVVDGPMANNHHVEDLAIFANGAVTYTVHSDTFHTKTSSSFTTRMKPDDLSGLIKLLDFSEIRELPKEMAAKTRPIDFFWDKSLQIVRSEGTQTIHIENFYPFLNLHGPTYPPKLIEVECRLQDIKAAATHQPKSNGDWCQDLLAHNVPESESYQCSDDEKKMKIAAGSGWGAIQIGASIQSIQAALGRGITSDKLSDVYFVEYRSRGIQISFNRADDKVRAIFFYNHQEDSGQFGVFCGQTAKGINWNSTIDDVRKAYGHPSADYTQENWERILFPGIDFRFENGSLVRIGIPGS